MVEKLIDVNDELLDTPYLQRIREQGRVEGRIEGKEEGLLAGLREAILETVTLRFDPVASIYRRVNHQLEQLTSREQLQQLLVVAVQAEDMSTFTTRLAEIVPAE